MQHESLIKSSWKILLHSKWAWFLTFTDYVILTIWSLGRENSGLITILFCCIDLVLLAMFLAIPIALATTMYHGHLGKSATFAEILADVKKYALRWLGLFILVCVPYLLIYFAVTRASKDINFILYLFTLNTLATFFGAFLILYVQLGMISGNLGAWDALKHGWRVWTIGPTTKALGAVGYSLTQVIVGLIIVVSQKGSFAAIFSISQQAYLNLLKLPHLNLLLSVYYALTAPILYAFVTATYFKDLDLMAPNRTVINSL